MNSKLMSRQDFTENLLSAGAKCFIRFISVVLPQPIGPVNRIPFSKSMFSWLQVCSSFRK